MSERATCAAVFWFCAVLLGVMIVYGNRWGNEADQRQAVEARRVRDSLVASHAAQHSADSARLVAWADRVVRLRGDSLAVAFAGRAQASRRWVYLPGRLDTLIQRDTIRDSVVVAGADLRADAIVDSARNVRADSLQGELDQAVYDLNECQERPERGPWAAFGAGVAVGAAGASAACIFAK